MVNQVLESKQVDGLLITTVYNLLWMPSVDVLINIHTTYFSCLDTLVTSVWSLLTLELLAGGSLLLLCISPCSSEGTPAPAEGRSGHPLSSKRGSRQAGCSCIRNKLAEGCCSQRCIFFWPPGQTAKGSQWEILPLLKSQSRDRTSSWAARLNQNHKLLGSVQGELGEIFCSANTGGKTWWFNGLFWTRNSRKHPWPSLFLCGRSPPPTMLQIMKWNFQQAE